MSDRIFFKGNPWPEGHPIIEFEWLAKEKNGEVWFDLHLKTDDYYAERDIEDDDEEEPPSSWESALVWGNFHACTLSSNYWDEGGFKVCDVEQYTPEFIDGLELEIDPDPDAIEDWDDMIFHIYLLGHDAVAKHKIKFERIGDSDIFNITWSGKIALAYQGDYDFKHDFSTTMTNVKFPAL